jgi:hypothetical protein
VRGEEGAAAERRAEGVENNRRKYGNGGKAIAGVPGGSVEGRRKIFENTTSKTYQTAAISPQRISTKIYTEAKTRPMAEVLNVVAPIKSMEANARLAAIAAI